MAYGSQTNAFDDTRELASSAASAVGTAATGINMAKTGGKLASKAAKAAGKATFKTAKLIWKLFMIFGPVVFVVLTILFILIFLFVVPLNTGIFGNLQTPEISQVQVYDDFKGRDLAVDKYQFMIQWEQIKSNLIELWNLTFHYDTIEERDAIMASYPQAVISDKDTDPAENPENGYNQAADGLVGLLDGAFRKGWAQSLAVAKDRAMEIYGDVIEGSTRPKLIDHFRSEITGETEIVFDPEEKFEVASFAEGTYEAGTFIESSNDTGADFSQYRFIFPDGTEIIQDEPTLDQDSVIYKINYQSPPEDKVPVYLNAILKLIAMQNCTEYIIERSEDAEGTETITFGVPIQFNGGDDAAYSEAERLSAEYQLMKLGNDIGGRGLVSLEELKNIEKEKVPEAKKPIYRVTATVRKPEPDFRNIDVYRTDYVIDYDADEESSDVIVVDGVPYSQRGDEVFSHIETYLEVNVTVKYNVVIRSAYDQILATRVTRDYTPEQGELFTQSLNDVYPSNMQVLRALYGYSTSTGAADNVVQVALDHLDEGYDIFCEWYGLSGRIEWCALFAGYCLDQCGLLTPDMAFSPSCSAWTAGLQANGRWMDASETPEPGMLIFYHHGHVGIVERVEDGRVYCVEGNLNDMVQQVSHSLDDPDIAGYGIVG